MPWATLTLLTSPLGTQATDRVPTYLGRDDPAGRFTDYYPAWMDRLASDVTLEGSMLDGAVRGEEAIRALIGGVRELYDRQDVNFAGPWGDNSGQRRPGVARDRSRAVSVRCISYHFTSQDADINAHRRTARLQRSVGLR